MIKKLCTILCLAAIVGCAHSQAKRTDVRYGYIKPNQVGSSPSFCFDGFLRKMEKAGCQKIGYETISIGYVKYSCADHDSLKSKSPLKTEEYFVIAFNRRKGQYVRPVPANTLALCADPSALLVTAPRD
jgi:hypothetical protein